MPAGVIINYYYEITDIENNVTVSESNEIEYLDDNFEWERVSGGGLEIVYHGLLENQAVNLHERVTKRIVPIKKTFLDNPNSFNIKGVLFDSRQESSEAFQYLSDTTTKKHLFGGFAYPDYDLFCDYADPVHRSDHPGLQPGQRATEPEETSTWRSRTSL